MSQPSYTYAFRPGENIRGEFLRLLAVLSAQASRLIPCAPEALPKSIHRTRTLIKRARSLLWFARSVLGPSASIRLRTCLRNAAQFLSAPRDLAVIQSTLKKLARNTSSRLDKDMLIRLAQTLVEGGEKPDVAERSLHDSLLKAVQFLLRALDEMEKITATSKRSWPFPSERLAQALLAVRKAEKKARRGGTDVQFHEWRKKVKRFLHQLELTYGQSDKSIFRTIRQVDRLQEKLGDYHDCVVAQNYLWKKLPAHPEAARIHQLLEKRKVRLREKAQRLSEAI